MPPSFIKRISRSSSALVTDGPNHHQRIMIRASSGGRSNPRCRSVTFCALIGSRPTVSRKRVVTEMVLHRVMGRLSESFSVQPLCSLCLCGGRRLQKSTTETQRALRLHREELVQMKYFIQLI